MMETEGIDPLYHMLEKSKCSSYYESFKELGVTLEDIVLLEKEDLSNTIKEPILCAIFWRNLLKYKEEQQAQRESALNFTGFQIEDSLPEENTRKRKAKGLLLEERQANKQHIILKNVTLTNLPTGKLTDTDYKKITEQILTHLKKMNVTKLRHGMLDGLCGYLIARYPVLDEQKYSGYEILKSKIINVLRNYRSFEKKKSKTEDTNLNGTTVDDASKQQQQQTQYILCIQQN